MTHPLTPHEKVVFKRPCEHCQRMTTVDLTALASGSGDHAELARLAEAATKGPWFETEGHPSGRTYGIHAEAGPVVVFRGIAKPHGRGEHNAAFIAAANPATVLALLAEIAALRAAKWEVKHVDTMNDMVLMGMARDEAEARATEAERKLAEAVGLLRDCLPWIRKITDLYGRVSAWLSKEAERG